MRDIFGDPICSESWSSAPNGLCAGDIWFGWVLPVILIVVVVGMLFSAAKYLIGER